VALVAADGLSPLAVARHAGPLVGALRNLLAEAQLTVSPVIQVSQGRVAIGDEIGERLQARLVVLLIGERPGLSAADSLGVYLTYAPCVGRTDAERNCISNIRSGGLDIPLAARRTMALIQAALARQLTGVALKESAQTLTAPTAPALTESAAAPAQAD
jgi:ethanolamine ammonia-lyase small subunit